MITFKYKIFLLLFILEKHKKIEKCTSAFLNFLSGTLSSWGKVECCSQQHRNIIRLQMNITVKINVNLTHTYILIHYSYSISIRYTQICSLKQPQIFLTCYSLKSDCLLVLFCEQVEILKTINITESITRDTLVLFDDSGNGAVMLNDSNISCGFYWQVFLGTDWIFQPQQNCL